MQACVVSAGWPAEKATGTDSLVERTYQYAYHHMCAHADLIENGGPAQIDREWVIDTTKMLLAHGYAHGLDMNEQPLDHTQHGMLQVHGYKRTLLVDTPWQVSGPYLYNLSDDGQDFWFQSEMWMELLKAQARKERKQWTLNKRTFPSALVRMGIAIPGKDQTCDKVTIAGKRERRLHIPANNLSTDIDQESQSKSQSPCSSALINSSQNIRAEHQGGQDIAQTRSTSHSMETRPDSPDNLGTLYTETFQEPNLITEDNDREEWTDEKQHAQDKEVESVTASKSALSPDVQRKNALAILAEMKREQITIYYVPGQEGPTITPPADFPVARFEKLIELEEQYRATLMALVPEPDVF